MRQSQLYSILLTVTAGAVTVAARQANFHFDGWTHQDLQQYVEDQKKNMERLGSQSLDDLKEILSDKWSLSSQPKPWWHIWPSSDSDSWFRHDTSTPISDWFFDTWSQSDLEKFLKRNKIDFDPKASKDTLVNAAKENFKQVSEKLDCSGFYPATGYFSDWSVDDLKDWLNEYEIPYDKASETKDDLLDKVRENLYHASELAEEKRLDVLNALDLAGKQLVDKAGQIKEDVFNTFSTQQLADWLQSHKVAVDEKTAENRDALIKLAKEHANLLKDDVSWYGNTLSKKASPYLSKSPEYVESVWDKTMQKFGGLFSHFRHKTNHVINDTFLVDLDNWTRDRLKTYLDVRGVKYHLLSTNSQLREMVKEARNKPLKNVQEGYARLTEGVNYENMKNWAQDKADQIQDSDVYSTVSDKIDSLNKDTQNWAQDLGNKWMDNLNSWSVEDLKVYLKSFGVDSTTSTKDDLIKAAKLKTQMFFGTFNEPWYTRWTYKAKFYLTHPLSLLS